MLRRLLASKTPRVMVQYLDPEQAHAVIERLGLHVRDVGLLHSALARPAASMFGADAYASIEEKAAALISSLAQNHSLFDGNKRIALILTFTFLKLNNFELHFSNDEAFDLVLDAAQGTATLEDLAERISARIRATQQ